jgi:hypothetical protein
MRRSDAYAGQRVGILVIADQINIGASQRWIQSGEQVITAGEIAQVEQDYGVIVHPTVKPQPG